MWGISVIKNFYSVFNNTITCCLYRMKIGIIGAGTWGTTLGCVLAEQGYPVHLWDKDTALRNALRTKRLHPRLPYLEFPPSLDIIEEVDTINDISDYVLIAVPSRAFRHCCVLLREKSPQSLIEKSFIIATKGIEPETGLTMSAILEDVLGDAVHDRMCVLSGPSHAEEVARKMPTVVVAAAHRDTTAQKVQELFIRHYFRVYYHSDVPGVELGGALKNVVAIAAGISDGLEMGDNAKAALLTRGLAEIIRLGTSLGGKIETFTGLSGIGDLIVTATSRHSRNRMFGELLAKGNNVQDALDRIGMVVEGVTTVISERELAEKFEVPVPIAQSVYDVIYSGVSPEDAARELMLRQPKPEIYGL